MASKTSARNRRLADRIKSFDSLAVIPCDSCGPDYDCFVMPTVSSRCERCARLRKKSCISTSWEAVDRMRESTSKKLAEEVAAEETVIQKLLKHRSRIARLQRTLKLAESRAVEQAKCLSDQLDEEAAAAGDPNNSIVITEMLSEVSELSSMSSAQINLFLSDFPTAAASAGSSGG